MNLRNLFYTARGYLSRGRYARKLVPVLLEKMKEKNTRIAELEQLVHVDELTGLKNRSGFNRSSQAIVKELQKCDEERRSQGYNTVAFFYMDVSNFKAVNDEISHPAGDTVLRAVAEGLRRRSRTGDTIARLGGDEFVYLMKGNDITQEWADKRADKIAAALTGDIRYTLNIAYGQHAQIAKVIPLIGVSVVATLYDGRQDLKTQVEQLDKKLQKIKGQTTRYRKLDLDNQI